MPSPAPKRRSPYADIPPITDFESCQRLRPVLLHRFGDVVGVWRHCENKTCRRRKSCRRSDWECLTAFMHAVPDKERRLFLYAVQHRRDGLSCDEAIARAEARVADEIARFGE
ncbi:MAG TPA: hypothetical protein VGN82_13715 [Bosea sp. (in: a-proteobacteria)]|jgi:hypothetical protein|uniref:hypothetical protein n=1 Tax=Bosea sp. (in: a-proteobacteria) TaxID=1871050 RepID=UPI002E1296B4|nr:hypothetical protein [Bosea sp. (in: a-proteobacteria)]